MRMRTVPSTSIYLSLLRCCSKNKSIHRIKCLYAHLQHHPRVLHALGNQTVAALASCGAIQEACDLAATLKYRTVLSWTGIISAYVAAGYAEEALRVHECMQLDGVDSNTYTFVCLFQACGMLEDLKLSMRLQAIAHFRNFTPCIYVSAILVNVYVKLGKLSYAERVFQESSYRTAVLWSTMLAGYAEHGRSIEVMLLYRQMKYEGFLESERTILPVLDACCTTAKREDTFYNHRGSAKAVSLEIIRALHADARKSGFESDIFVSSTLISAYGKCGAVTEAENVFVRMPCRNEVSWCAMLSAYVEGRQGEKALRLYHEALNQMIIPGKVMFVLAVQACSALVKEGTITKEVSNERVALEIGYALHMDASGERHTSEALVVNTIIRMYGKCGALEEAENAFHALCQPDVVSFNALLSVFVEHNQDDKALSLFCHMIKINMALDPVACICTLQAAGKMGNLNTTEFIHFGVICWSLEDIPSLIATLIAAYGNCSCLNAFFLELIIPYMSSWNVSISGYAHGGNLVESMSYTEQLRLMGQKPDSIALTSVLSCYSHSGFVIEGLEFFIRMWEDYHVSADLQHYGAVLDLLARAVSFSKLKDLLKKMPMESDISIWSCVLSACCRHGNKELADFVFDRAIQFEDGAAYVLMSNFFVDALIEDSTIESS